MTYNFDPDKWFDNEHDALEARFKSGELSERQYKDALDDLERRHEDMWERLNGTYQLP